MYLVQDMAFWDVTPCSDVVEHDVSEGHADSVFRFDILTHHARRHNPEDHDLNFITGQTSSLVKYI
jgi:hypothetical protein